MTRGKGLRSWLAGLAMMSALLMAFAPSASRVLASHASAPVASASDQEACPEHMREHGDAAAPASPQPHHLAGDEVCGYCTLAAHLLSPVTHPFVGVGPLHVTQPPILDISTPQRRIPANLRSLGSQAPPLG